MTFLLFNNGVPRGGAISIVNMCLEVSSKSFNVIAMIYFRTESSNPNFAPSSYLLPHFLFFHSWFMILSKYLEALSFRGVCDKLPLIFEDSLLPMSSVQPYAYRQSVTTSLRMYSDIYYFILFQESIALQVINKCFLC